MKFMLIRRADADTEQGRLPSDEILQEMARYNGQMASAGVFVCGEGLRPSREGYRINFHVHMAFEETFWASGFGMAVDRYGIGWMVNVEKTAHQEDSL